MSALCSRVLAQVHDTIEMLVAGLGAGASSDGAPLLLDVGCWEGVETLRYASAIGARCRGVEVFESPAQAAEQHGIEVARLDLESQPFPWADAETDVVVCNQVLEHLKNIWLPLSEMYRVLRPGGHLVVSVPNLASLHNRVLLAIGRQPTSIRTFGPHVRGYARDEFERLIGFGGGLRVVRTVGVGFHPIPAPWSTLPARWWPGASHTIVLVARKIRHAESPWQGYLRGQIDAGMQTHY